MSMVVTSFNIVCCNKSQGLHTFYSMIRQHLHLQKRFFLQTTVSINILFKTRSWYVTYKNTFIICNIQKQNNGHGGVT